MRVKSSASSRLPLLIEPAELHAALAGENIIVIDLSMPGVYKSGHVPGAVWLSYPTILYPHDDTDCDIPQDDKLTLALSTLGIKPEHHVIAYDSQGCPMAARLLWTLDEIGHAHFSMLNGGWAAWRAAGLPIETEARTLPASTYNVQRTTRCNILRGEIGKKLHDKNVVLLDCRSAEEFSNELIITDRGGHIPGAVHYDWMNAINEADAMRMQPADVLRAQMKTLGVRTEKEIIVYCQTHMRSAYVYMMLKNLGYTRICAYAAGYSEWGNALDTPISNGIAEVQTTSPTTPEIRPTSGLTVVAVTPDKPVVNKFLALQGEALVAFARSKMLGIQSLVNSWRTQRPFQGLRVSGCLPLTPGTGALICALVELGASVRWADIAADDDAGKITAWLQSLQIPVFTCALHTGEQALAQGVVEQALVFPGERMPQILIDDNDENCLLSISEQHQDAVASVPSLALDQIHAELDGDNRKLLVELMLLAKWELRACDDLPDMRIWAANPMVCHCNSVVMLKNMLCACA